MKKIFVLFLFLITMSLILLNRYSQTNAQSVYPEVQAADFTLQGIDGKAIVLTDIIRQRYALLVFWTTWCSICEYELPLIEEFYQKNREQVEVIGIAVGESTMLIKWFLRKIKISYPVVLDSYGRVARLYSVSGVPTIVVVDKDKRILYYGHSIEEMVRKVEFR